MNARWNIISPNDIGLIKADCAVRTVEFHRELPTTNDLALQRATLEELDAPKPWRRLLLQGVGFLRVSFIFL